MPDFIDFDSQGFTRAFADALWQYLQGRMQQNEAAKLLGLSPTRLNNYFHDLPDGTRKEPMASVLHLACTKLPGFSFDYGGYRLRAIKLGEKRQEKATEQMTFRFYRQITAGRVNVRVKRPPGRIELSFSLGATTRRKARKGVSVSGNS
jgi:hypothetical protein